MTAPTPVPQKVVPSWFPLLIALMAGAGLSDAFTSKSVGVGLVSLGLAGLAYWLQTKVT